MTDGQYEPNPVGGLIPAEALKTFTAPDLRLRLYQAEQACPTDQRRVITTMMLAGGGHPGTSPATAYEKWLDALRAVRLDLIGQLAKGKLVAFVHPDPVPPMGPRMRVAADKWGDSGVIRSLTFSDVIYIGGVKYVSLRIWRAVDLEASGPQPNNSSGKAAASCEAWLRGLVDTGGQRKKKDEYRVEAMGKFHGLSGRQFNAVWQFVTAGRDDWGRSGRRKK